MSPKSSPAVPTVYTNEKYVSSHDKEMLVGECVKRFASLNRDGTFDVVYRRTGDGGKKATTTVKPRSK